VAGSTPGSGEVARRDAGSVGSTYRFNDYKGLSRQADRLPLL
jgi:hypothetical protein